MKNYDVIVIGSGCGAVIADEASSRGRKVALIDKGPLIGGTCLNWGCIPSKMLIYTADRIVDVQESAKLGFKAEISEIDFKAIMERMRHSRKESQEHLRASLKEDQHTDFYEGEARFTRDYTLEVNGEQLKGKDIFIATGSRPLIPPIKGLETIDYLTNESALELTERPESLIIIGGGYIAAEYGHFFAAMGTKVTLVEMADRLILSEEPEIAEALLQSLSRRMTVYTGARAEAISPGADGVTLTVADNKTGKKKRLSAARVMLAVGRRSNADLLQVDKTGVELDDRGFIKVNEHLQTSQENIYAVGDANGRAMFTHVANREAAIAAQNVFHGASVHVDYSAVPHAVYSRPQIASVGLGEEEAAKDHDIIIAGANYYDTAKGEAMLETEGFAKAIIEKETDAILGFHVIGPYAPELIQEVINAMASGGNLDEINEGLHIHPALSELVPITLNSYED